MDGLTAIAKSSDKIATYLVDDNFMSETLLKILKVLEDGQKSNTINEDIHKSSSIEEEIEKNKKINSSLKTSATKINDIKTDVSDRVGAVVIVSTLNEGFKKTVEQLKLLNKKSLCKSLRNNSLNIV